MQFLWKKNNNVAKKQYYSKEQIFLNKGFQGWNLMLNDLYLTFISISMYVLDSS